MADGVYSPGGNRGDFQLRAGFDENRGYVGPGSDPHEQIDWVNAG